jgi:hypothetical protein
MHTTAMLFLSGAGIIISMFGILDHNVSLGVRGWAATSGLWALSTFLAYL